MNKALLTILGFLGICALATAQKPTITSIDKISGGMTEIVSIQGTGFGIDDTKVVVFFGAMKGTIENISDQLIEVHIPHGATYDNISVTNLTNGLTAYSRPDFTLSFGADFGFNLANLVGQTDFSAGAGLYNLCSCDFDGDSRNDFVTTNDNGVAAQTTISVHTNTSSGPGNINFSTSTINIGGRSQHVRCGDLNGDGKPDLVINEGSSGSQDRIFILQNNSAGSITFLAPLIIKQTGKNGKHFELVDMDLDGKPEIVIADQLGIKVSVFHNQSAGAISFAPAAFEVSVVGAVTTDALAVEDLNGDGLPDIVVAPYLSSGKIYLTQNTSTPGSISFGPVQSLTTNDVFLTLKLGDLDGDGKADIIATQLKTPPDISLFLNTTTGSSITFGPEQRVPVDGVPWGIDFGDLDGDSKPDIVVASITQKSLTILNNVSTPGAFSFQQHIKPTTYINRHVTIADLDGDGKPDIGFTSIDDINNGIPSSKLSVFRNKACMVPEITPEGPLTLCTGVPLRLFSSVSRGTTYEWKLNGTTQTSGANPFFDVTAAGNYTVTAIAEGGTCSEVSEPVTINISGTASGTASIAPFDPICPGGTLLLKVNNPIAGATYTWTGPDNYTSTSASTSTSVTNFQPVKAGRYYLDVVVGSCLYQRLSEVAVIIDIDFPLTYPGSEVICQGDTKLLTVPNAAGFTYEWLKNGTTIPLETGNTYLASATGRYTVKIKSPGCGEVERSVDLVVVTLPVAQFTSSPSGTACTSEKIQFTNQSTTDPAATPVYSWTFGDTGTSTDKDPNHQYTAANTFTINLIVSYGSCISNTASASITTTAVTPPQIINPDNAGVFSFCEGDSIRLGLTNVFDTYLWSTGETTPSIYAKENEPYSVDVTVPAGCVVSDEQAVTVTQGPAVLLSATPNQITEGESSQLEATGLNDYTWTPPDGLSDPSIFNPIATPLVTTTYVVTGSAAGFSCAGLASIEIIVKGEPIVNKLIPGKFISPNQDEKNQAWIVQKIEEFDQCGVAIYDDKGVKVFEAKPYLNDWDGTFNGQKLPDGVYYYIIRCDGEENKPRTGSITVLR